MFRPSHRRPPLHRALLGSLAASLALACSYEPGFDPLSFDLSDSTREAIAEADAEGALTMRPEAVESHVAGALQMLFGTPSYPQFLLTEDWVDDEFDPNRGDLELSDEEWQAVKDDNRRRRFKLQFQLLEARRYAEVQKPKYALDLWQRWREGLLPRLLEDPEAPADDDYYDSLHDQALGLWEGWYPTLRESAEMYRQQCLHCHGVEGGGDGPTAPFLEPKPRDYRKGIFKWVAVGTKQQPRRADLLRVLSDGVNGTAMPPFARFSKGELHGLVDYVRLLGIRGQVETLITLDATGNGYVAPDSVQENYALVWEGWNAAEENYVAYEGEIPPPTPQMIERGHELFLGELAQCASCHGPDGRGNGPSIKETDAEGNEVIRLDEWGNPSSPRNFQQAVFRGGSRPIDLYRRIKYGISGTIMPAAAAELGDEDIWSLVYYVRSVVEQHDHARLLEHKAELAATHAAEHGHGADHGSGSGAADTEHGAAESAADEGHDGAKESN